MVHSASQVSRTMPGTWEGLQKCLLNVADGIMKQRKGMKSEKRIPKVNSGQRKQWLTWKAIMEDPMPFDLSVLLLILGHLTHQE